jgi:queuine tRNA-ribosyltransferase
MRRIRTAILEDRFPDFVRDFFAKYFETKGTPEWAVEALRGVGIDI